MEDMSGGEVIEEGEKVNSRKKSEIKCSTKVTGWGESAKRMTLNIKGSRFTSVGLDGE